MPIVDITVKNPAYCVVAIDLSDETKPLQDYRLISQMDIVGRHERWTFAICRTRIVPRIREGGVEAVVVEPDANVYLAEAAHGDASALRNRLLDRLNQALNELRVAMGTGGDPGTPG